jgi:hypothetical protein
MRETIRAIPTPNRELFIENSRFFHIAFEVLSDVLATHLINRVLYP